MVKCAVTKILRRKEVNMWLEIIAYKSYTSQSVLLSLNKQMLGGLYKTRCDMIQLEFNVLL